MPPNTCTSNVVRIQLTAQQVEQLAPLVQQSIERRENILFVATAVPFWLNGTAIWELQSTVIPARIGQRIRKLVLSESAVIEEVVQIRLFPGLRG
jgi:hypothetical protein